MSDSRLPEDEQFASGGSLQGWHLIAIAAVMVAVAAGAYYWNYVRTPAESPAPVPTTVTDVPEGSRTVTLFFAGVDDPVLVAETRQVAIGVEYDEQLKQVLRALATGPQRDAVSTLPDGTRLLDVFYDPESFTVYADFSAELVAGHPGGTSAEFFTVSAIMKTISENFPEVQAVQILVEGSQVSTIAGHIDAFKPMRVRDWR